jgi:hypothetical protein
LDGYFAVQDIKPEQYTWNGIKVKAHQKYLALFN